MFGLLLGLWTATIAMSSSTLVYVRDHNIHKKIPHRTIVDTIDNAIQKSIETLDTLGQLTLEDLRKMLEDYWNAFTSSMTNLVNRVTESIDIGLKGYFKIFPELWLSILHTFRTMLLDYWTAFQELFDRLINQVMGGIDIGLKGYFSSMNKLWVKTLDTFRAMLLDYWNAFSSLFHDLMKRVMDAIDIGLKGYFKIFPEIWLATLTTFRDMLRDYWNAFVNLFSLLINRFSELVKDGEMSYFQAVQKISGEMITNGTEILKVSTKAAKDMFDTFCKEFFPAERSTMESLTKIATDACSTIQKFTFVQNITSAVDTCVVQICLTIAKISDNFTLAWTKTLDLATHVFDTIAGGKKMGDVLKYTVERSLDITTFVLQSVFKTDVEQTEALIQNVLEKILDTLSGCLKIEMESIQLIIQGYWDFKLKERKLEIEWSSNQQELAR